MKKINSFHPYSAGFVIKGLEILGERMSERKVYILNSTIGIDQKLVTKDVNDDIWVIDYLEKEIVKDSHYLSIEDKDPEYLKAGLLMYKDKLMKAEKIANTQEL